MNNSERVDVIKGFGYGEREATFLCWAALHGGYFLRRQYAFFLGKDSGGTVAALCEKLISQEHARTLTALNNTKIYHLASRPFYTSIGEPDNRNRREHAPAAIKTRLMGLDFALANREYRYLATERQKLDYFGETLGIPLSDLPSKRYVSRKSAATTTRYFVDKYPIFLKEHGANQESTTVSFGFVDPCSTTLSSFETYLPQYASLWRHLKSFEVIYVADTPKLQAAAERRFGSFLKRFRRADHGGENSLTQRLIEHFEARFLYEKGEMDTFSREKLIRLRNEIAQYSAPKYQELYEQWKAGARATTEPKGAPNSSPQHAFDVKFSTYLVPGRYDFLGGITGPNERSPNPSGPTPGARQGVGAVVSVSLESRAT